MTGRTHNIIGFAGLVTAAALFPPTHLNGYTLAACIVGNVIGSLLPDIDDAGNRLWDFLPAGNFVGSICRRAFYRHRTITHSILGGFLVYKGLWWLLPRIFNPAYVDIKTIFISIMIGYVCHLFADMLTKDGVPLLFPFKWYFGIPPIQFLRITTGSFFENALIFPGVIVYIVLFIGKNKEQFLQLFQLVRG